MIAILYDSNETSFASNGLCRLRDCISCTVTEERNGIYECDFDYPIDGANFDMIQPGRIIACEHDYTGDVQPFDIVGYEKPINGVVTFHAVHISYRQRGYVAHGTGINSLADAFAMLEAAEPENPFEYETDISPGAGYMAAADGIPRSVREFLGGVEGSILDTYGGEYEFDRFRVILHQQRGQLRNLTIRYGLNLLDYNDESDFQDAFTSCVPFWAGDTIVIGNKVDSGEASYNGRDVCAALDLTEKYETAPTAAQLEATALSLMQNRDAHLPSRSITVDFVQLADTLDYSGTVPIERCRLCDSVRVVLPRYNMDGTFRIVKTVWNVLKERFDSLELGALSTTLAEALGLSNDTGGFGSSRSVIDRVEDLEADVLDLQTEYVTGTGTSGNWRYRLYSSGRFEAWLNMSATITLTTAQSGASGWYRNSSAYSLPSLPPAITNAAVDHAGINVITGLSGMETNISAMSGGTVSYYVIYSGQLTNRSATITAYVTGTYS